MRLWGRRQSITALTCRFCGVTENVIRVTGSTKAELGRKLFGDLFVMHKTRSLSAAATTSLRDNVPESKYFVNPLTFRKRCWDVLGRAVWALPSLHATFLAPH